MGTYLLNHPTKSSCTSQIEITDHYRNFQAPLANRPLQLKTHSFKIDDILNPKGNSAHSSSTSSPLSSLPSPYHNHSHQNEFLLSHANSFLNSNSFMSGLNCFSGNQEIINNLKSYTAFMDQQSNLAYDYLKNQNTVKTQQAFFVNNKQPRSDDNTIQKLAIIDQIAKQIDQNNALVTEKKMNKGSKLEKKNVNESQNRSLKLKKKSVRSGCCGSATCSSNLDQHQLPMCLRGTSEEQVHLASLFNTLIHHKKCRRTRTVFTDMQLIGLEKRFENQKYLSTPDRIQLADFLGLSQLQVKTWYQNRRMKWKKKVLKDGSKNAPTKPKGRPKKDSIPSFSEILKAAAAEKMNSTGSETTGKNDSSLDESRSVCSEDEDEMDLSDDDEDEEIYEVEDSDSEQESELIVS